MYYFLLTSLLFFLLTGCGSDSTTVSTVSVPQNKLIFASLDNSTDKIISALQTGGVTVENTSTPDKTRYSAVIVDCNNRTSEQILNDGNIRNFLYKGVVFIDPLEEHKKAIRSLIGFGGHVNLPSDAFFIKSVPGREGNEYIIYDYPGASALNTDNFFVSANDTDPNTNESDPNYLAFNIIDKGVFEQSQQNFLDTVDAELQNNFATSVVDSYSNTINSRDSNAPPAQAKYLTWTYTQLSTFHADASWAKVYNPTFGSDKMASLYPRAGYGGQTFQYGHTIVISLLLNNDPKSQTEPFQYLTVDYTGQTNPQYGKSGNLPMNGYNGQSEDAGGDWSSTSLKAWQWVQTGYSFDCSLSDAGAGDLLFVNGSPPNVNNVTTYTSGYQVSVGFNAGASPAGPSAGVTGSYTWVNTHTTSIPDWGCTFTNTSNNYNWTWTTRNPAYSVPYAAHFGGFNNLSYNLFQPSATLVLKTNYPSKKLVNLNAKDTLMQVAAQFEHDTTIHYYGLTAYFINPGILNNELNIDLGSVFYADIKDFDIAPSTVNAGQNATGTITLDNTVTADTVINISSLNTDWATVPDTVTVPSGKQQVDFPITTKRVTGNPTVKIHVGYRKIIGEGSLTINGFSSSNI